MRLSLKAMAISFGVLWGACLLLVGLINLAAPSYGAEFLRGMGSVYPGFYSTRNFGDVLLGTLYGAVDGLIAGFVLGWLYNRFVGSSRESGAARLDRAA